MHLLENQVLSRFKRLGLISIQARSAAALISSDPENAVAKVAEMCCFAPFLWYTAGLLLLSEILLHTSLRGFWEQYRYLTASKIRHSGTPWDSIPTISGSTRGFSECYEQRLLFVICHIPSIHHTKKIKSCILDLLPALFNELGLSVVIPDFKCFIGNFAYCITVKVLQTKWLSAEKNNKNAS